MSFGKGGGTQVTTQELTPEQRQMIAAQTDLFKNTMAPTYQQAVQGGRRIGQAGAPLEWESIDGRLHRLGQPGRRFTRRGRQQDPQC